MELQRKKIQFLADEGAAVLVEPSSQGDGGTLFVSVGHRARRCRLPHGAGGQDRPAGLSAYDKDAPKIIPQIVLAKEHYNRLVRMCEQAKSSRWPSISRSSSMTTT